MQLGTDHLPPRKIIYQENNSSDIKSTDYGKADDAQSSTHYVGFPNSDQDLFVDQTLLTTCSFGHRPVYFGFPNSDQDLLVYQTILMTCSFGHRPDCFGFPNSEQDLFAY
jgi:hypothetical protein